MKVIIICFFAFCMLVCCGEQVQQIYDTDFSYHVEEPAYGQNEGPVVLIDEAHNNFHTMGGRYTPFANILKQDGFSLEPGQAQITEDLLEQCKVFVISVPMSENNESAYIEDEIKILQEWVSGGGSLLLITDHHPDPPAMAKLAAAFPSFADEK